jgi:hypothetical protein
MWPFKKKQPDEAVYAHNIYEGLVAHNEFGDITALSLRIPSALHTAYQNKILLQREMLAFAALMENAEDSRMQRVCSAYASLVVGKAARRGLQITVDQLADHVLKDTEQLIADPYPWAQSWLAEFRDNPKDEHMVALFADHCLRLHHAYKNGIEQTRR